MSQLYSMLVTATLGRLGIRAALAGSRGCALRAAVPAVPGSAAWAPPNQDGQIKRRQLSAPSQGWRRTRQRSRRQEAAVCSSGRAHSSSGELTHQSLGRSNLLPARDLQRDPSVGQGARQRMQRCASLGGIKDSPTQVSAGRLLPWS